MKQSIEDEEIAVWVESYKRDLGQGVNPIIRKTAEAKISILTTAPRDIHKLKALIATKSKEYRDCSTFPERDILRAEIDALEHVRAIVITKGNNAAVIPPP